jgi:hypothetical protein
MSREILRRKGGRGRREMEKNLKWKFESLLAFLSYLSSVLRQGLLCVSQRNFTLRGFGTKRCSLSVLLSLFALTSINQNILGTCKTLEGFSNNISKPVSGDVINNFTKVF